MRQAIALIAAIPIAYIGYIATYLTPEPEGILLMAIAAMLAAIAILYSFSKYFAFILDYVVYAVAIVVFIGVIYEKLF